MLFDEFKNKQEANMLPLELNYPFNLYTQVLAKAGISLYALHFGLMQSDNDFVEGQQRLEQQILRALGTATDNTRRVLQIDAGLATLAPQIAQAGFDYTGLVVGGQQAEYCQQQQPQLKWSSTPFLEWDESQTFDKVVLLESAQRFEPNMLLAKLTALLADGGQAVIAETVTAELLESLPAKLASLNARILAKQDLSEQIIPSLDYLLELLYQHRNFLLKTEKVSQIKLSQLLHRIETSRQQLLDKKQIYLLASLGFDKIH